MMRANIDDGSAGSGDQLLLNTQNLELAYEKCMHDVRVICEEERARQLRLQILLLEDENDDLHEQLTEGDQRIDDLEKEMEEARLRIAEIEEELHATNNDLRTRDREVDALRAELNSLHEISTDSTKLLTEKLALSRELSQLKPQLEHLQAQTASQQSLLSEKLSLQRQLSTLQVELEMEKRASSRLQNKEERDGERESQLERELDALRKELSKEKKEREMLQKEAKKGATDWEGKKAVLESKLDAFRTKLRSTKDQLKETQTELQQARAAASAAAARSGNPGKNEYQTKNPRKRTAAQMDTYGTVGTPGVENATTRNIQKVAAMPGEKSTFSITPFLNRTASIAPDSPPKNDEDAEVMNNAQKPDQTIEEEDVEVNSPTESRKMEPSAVKSVPKAGILTTSKPSKNNARAPGNKRKVGLPSMEKVMEEDENSVPADLGTKSTGLKRLGNKPLTIFSGDEDPEPKKKKRKLLGSGIGKTLFDEDDEGAPKPVPRKPFNAGKKFGNLGSKSTLKIGLGGALGGAVSGFGDFSPLKKDRRNLAM